VNRDRSYWYAASKIAGAYSGVFEDARAWPAIGTASLSGYERSRVLVNRGLAGLERCRFPGGRDGRYDGRAIVLVDLFNRGVLDVVIANQKQPALVYKNSVAPATTGCLQARGHPVEPQRHRREVTLEPERRGSCRSWMGAWDSRARTTGGCTSGWDGPGARTVSSFAGRRAPYRPSSSSPWTACIVITEPGASRSLWVRLGRMDPRYPVSFLITLILVLGEARYGSSAGTSGSSSRSRLRGQRARAVTPAARLVRERAVPTSRISLALLIKPRADLLWRSPWADSSRSPPNTCCATATGTCGTQQTFAISLCSWRRRPACHPQPPVGQRPGTNAVIWGFGLLIVSRVHLLHVTLTYVACFVALAVLRHWNRGRPLLAKSRDHRPMYQLFIFFMITDPKTTVSTVRGRISVAAAVARGGGRHSAGG